MWMLRDAQVVHPSSIVAGEGCLLARDGAYVVAKDSMVLTECSMSLVILVADILS